MPASSVVRRFRRRSSPCSWPATSWGTSSFKPAAWRSGRAGPGPWRSTRSPSASCTWPSSLPSWRGAPGRRWWESRSSTPSSMRSRRGGHGAGRPRWGRSSRTRASTWGWSSSPGSSCVGPRPRSTPDFRRHGWAPGWSARRRSPPSPSPGPGAASSSARGGRGGTRPAPARLRRLTDSAPPGGRGAPRQDSPRPPPRSCGDRGIRRGASPQGAGAPTSGTMKRAPSSS